MTNKASERVPKNLMSRFVSKISGYMRTSTACKPVQRCNHAHEQTWKENRHGRAHMYTSTNMETFKSVSFTLIRPSISARLSRVIFFTIISPLPSVLSRIRPKSQTMRGPFCFCRGGKADEGYVRARGGGELRAAPPPPRLDPLGSLVAWWQAADGRSLRVQGWNTWRMIPDSAKYTQAPPQTCSAPHTLPPVCIHVCQSNIARPPAETQKNGDSYEFIRIKTPLALFVSEKTRARARA